DSAKFGEFREVPSGLTADRLFLSWTPSKGYYFDLTAVDLSQLDQRIHSEIGRQDHWRVSVVWVENPRRVTDQAKQLYAGQAGNIFTLDDAFQSAVQAGTANVDLNADGQWDAGTKGAIVKNGIAQGAQDVFVGWHRETGGVGFEATPNRHWTFNVSGAREDRSGTYAQGLGMYFSLSPSEVASSLDYRTDWERAGAEYASRKFNAGVQVTASQFDTGYNSLTWDDQLFLNDLAVNANTANPARGRMTIATNNKMQMATVYGGFNLPGRTRIDATASRSTMTQDDPFLPMTTNTLLNPAALPAASLDGTIDINLLSFKISGRPTKVFRWSAWARDYQYDNQTPSLTFTDYVMTDYQFPTCGNANECGTVGARLSRRSLPYGYEHLDYGASFGLHPTTWFDGQIAVNRDQITREFSAVTDGHEDMAKLVLDFDVNSWLTVRTTARHLERRADEYDAEYHHESFPTGEANVAAVNEGMRKFIWTDRDRDQVDVHLDFGVTEKVSIYAESSYARDIYYDPNTGKEVGDSYITQEDRNFDTVPETYDILIAGRTDDKYLSYTLGFGYVAGPRVNLYADYTWEKGTWGLETRYRAPVAGVGSDDPLDNWGTDTDDRYKTAVLGLSADLSGDNRWRANVDASRSEGTGNIVNHFVPGGQASSDTTLLEFPELKTTLNIVQAGLTHSVRKNLDWTVRYWFESWHEDNFASDFSQPYMGDPGNDPGSATAIFLGLDYANYTNHLLTFLLHYSF
ncbi:MAG TPA: MtrB/PioB family outer membrane beta-barrel protein, partial [Candidatus Polarisedimenticolia bacterium]|nr:MtrB/PioB family outer membrane beta-barrel protein [Candidatus Polarisedimenticolia bacterium]